MVGRWGGGATRLERGRSITPAAERGQATLEMALLLPLLALLLLCVVQIAVVVHAKVMTVHGAREAARAESVGEPGDVGLVAARTGLSAGRLSVASSGGDDRVTVTVRYVDPTNVPLIGVLVPDIVLESTATMRRERWPD